MTNKIPDHICCGCIDRAYAAGYDCALQRISNLRDIEKTQQELSDMKQRHDGLMAILKLLVHNHNADFIPVQDLRAAWEEAEEIVSTNGAA
jgi:hypothetical protein